MGTYFTLWVIIQNYFIYFVAQIVLALATKTSFSLTPVPLWHI